MSNLHETNHSPITTGPAGAWTPPPSRHSRPGRSLGVVLVLGLVLGLGVATAGYFLVDGLRDDRHGATVDATTVGGEVTTLEGEATTAEPAGVGSSGGGATSDEGAGTGAPAAATEPGDPEVPAPALDAPDATIPMFGKIGLDGCGPGHDDQVRVNLVWNTTNATRVEMVFPGGATRTMGASGTYQVFAFCGDPPITFVLQAYSANGHVATRSLAVQF